MTTKSDARCIIRINDVPRVIFSVSERREFKDLVIRLKSATFFGADNQSEQIVEQRYSVHPSEESPTNINVIKQTITLNSGEKLTTANYTAAIKQENRFAPIFIALTPSLAPERYVSNNATKRLIDLGSYEPTRFVLMYFLLVSDANRQFTPLASPDFNVSQLQFTKFRVTVLWSFAASPSDAVGWRKHWITIPPEIVPDDLKGPMRAHTAGHDENGCVSLFEVFRRQLLAQFLSFRTKRMVSEGLPIPEFVATVPTLGFFREGHIGTSEFSARLVSLVLSGALRPMGDSR